MNFSKMGISGVTCYISGLPTLFPKMMDNKNRTRKMKNNILAIEAAPAAIPPKPNTAAMMAITRNTTVQRNIKNNFRL